MNSRFPEWGGRFIRGLVKVVFTSIFLTVVVGLFLAHTQEVRQTHIKANIILEDARMIALEGIHPTMGWNTSRREYAFEKLSSSLRDLRHFLPPDLQSCLATIVGDAKLAADKTYTSRSQARSFFEGRIEVLSAALKDWYKSEIYYFGFFRSTIGAGC